MPDVKWDGKLYRLTKFGEGMKPGTVEWEHNRRRRRAQMGHWREEKLKMPELQSDSFVVRAVKKVIKVMFRIR